MSGYSAPYIGLPDPEKKRVGDMEPQATQSSIAERRGKSWYKKLSLSIRGNGKSNRSSTIPEKPTSPAKIREEYLNKPLPALPGPELQPYFEYMFADAGMKKKKSTETLRSSAETDSNTQESTQSEYSETCATHSNGSAESYGLNGSEVAQFAFAQAGVNVSTKDMIDNHFAALGTSLEGALDLATLADDLEGEKATEDFFGGIEVKEAPSPDHVPVVDEEGFVDRREGLEDWPQLWRNDKETLVKSTASASEELAVQHSNTTIPDHFNGTKHILQPKSQKNKVRLQDPSFPDSYQTVTPIITGPAVQTIQSPVRAPRPLTIRTKNKSHHHNHTGRISKKNRANKRSARDSFVTKSTINQPKSDDNYNINLLPTKKVRVTETQPDQDLSSPSRAASVCGSISSPSSVDLTSPNTPNSSDIDNHTDTDITDAEDDGHEDTASVLSLKHKRLTTSLTGFPGQFESYEAEYLGVRATLAAPELFTAGDANHPNGLFSHTNFVADPTYPACEYTPAMLAALPVRDLALKHAENATQSYACSPRVSILRTPTQAMLRRELHRECAAARLEGVSVGEYRYYQGFMSLEEYLAARVCVCWAFCWCSKLCGRYADVLCPCSEWIAVHGDDD
ncbi:hypothetical protein A1O7_08455 [Cladophialophora yegresii CBS 114405]|uniref:Uncharacterized protein n=1 Tax=Cladophialophora yegresii CBS 114405 TaxID=1182544 RepID=W9VIL7_9EURO|nr:uncharacterized protein A1O7_08455 [Cladophialophora yegresii CBS 114405]EXJ55527.1 hypothetical protein A1O7_08455 [Cladophialophora yegresii CBS 114405]